MTQKTSVGVRIHDMHHGLIQGTGAIIETEYDLLRGLGAAIQIATTIKDHETITDLKQLYAAAGELKIPKPLTKEALDRLEHLGFVRLRRSSTGKEITRVDVTVPAIQKVYTDFGDYFLSENKSVIAGKTIDILERLSSIPHKEKDLISSIGLSPDQYDQIRDVCKSTSLIDTYVSPKDSQSVIYSPLYWDDNPVKVFELLKTYNTNEVLKSIEQIKNYQGLPDVKFSKEKILVDAIDLGCMPSISVTSTTGTRKFLFTPKTGVGKLEKGLLHKARVLISCVRYGENFAGITKINNPEVLLNALVRRGYLKGHTESLTQYEAARNLGLVKIIPSYGSRFEVHFIDNDENQIVVKMALEMLEIGDTSKLDAAEEMAKKMMLPGAVMHPTETRTHTLKTAPTTRSKATIEKINDLLRGIDA